MNKKNIGLLVLLMTSASCVVASAKYGAKSQGSPRSVARPASPVSQSYTAKNPMHSSTPMNSGPVSSVSPAGIKTPSMTSNNIYNVSSQVPVKITTPSFASRAKTAATNTANYLNKKAETVSRTIGDVLTNRGVNTLRPLNSAEIRYTKDLKSGRVDLLTGPEIDPRVNTAKLTRSYEPNFIKKEIAIAKSIGSDASSLFNNAATNLNNSVKTMTRQVGDVLTNRGVTYLRPLNTAEIFAKRRLQNKPSDDAQLLTSSKLKNTENLDPIAGANKIQRTIKREDYIQNIPGAVSSSLANTGRAIVRSANTLGTSVANKYNNVFGDKTNVTGDAAYNPMQAEVVKTENAAAQKIQALARGYNARNKLSIETTMNPMLSQPIGTAQATTTQTRKDPRITNSSLVGDSVNDTHTRTMAAFDDKLKHARANKNNVRIKNLMDMRADYLKKIPAKTPTQPQGNNTIVPVAPEGSPQLAAQRKELFSGARPQTPTPTGTPTPRLVLNERRLI